MEVAIPQIRSSVHLSLNRGVVHSLLVGILAWRFLAGVAGVYVDGRAGRFRLEGAVRAPRGLLVGYVLRFSGLDVHHCDTDAMANRSGRRNGLYPWRRSLVHAWHLVLHQR